MIAALFLLVVALFALIIKTNKGTLVGGVSRSIVNEFQFLECSDLNLLVHSLCGRTMQTTVLEEHSAVANKLHPVYLIKRKLSSDH